MDERSKRVYRAKKFESKNKYNVQRSYPRLLDVIINALSGNIISDFEEIGNHMNSAADPNGRLIIFIAGGFSVNELCAVQQFQKENGRAEIILGGTDFLSADDMIKMSSFFGDG